MAMRKERPIRTATGWRIELGKIVVDADHPYHDRNAIRVVLTVRNNGTIVYRNTVNLTAARARRGVIKTMKARKIKLPGRVLIALDEACRSGGGRREDEGRRDDGYDISETPPLDLAGLTTAFRKWLLIRDEALLPVFVGAILAHRLGDDPVWLLIVGPPGGTKSELLRSLYRYPGIYALSDLTPRTLASGLDRGNPSLLSRLDQEILVLKDFTTVLEGARDERQKVLGQLREIHDGRFDQAWGTGRELHWEGRLGFVAGVTEVIDQHQAAMAILGERFVTFRPIMPHRRKMARYALRSRGKRQEMRRELATAMHGFLRSRSGARPGVTEDVLDILSIVADFVTRARSPVRRGGSNRELLYAPEPEAPTRLAKSLLSLASGIALAFDSPSMGKRELRLVIRVAFDCLPGLRHRIIDVLLRDHEVPGERGLPAPEIAKALRSSPTAVRRALEDLHALRVVRRRKVGAEFHWRVREQYTEVLVCFREASRTA
jgi:hypothetical protein